MKLDTIVLADNGCSYRLTAGAPFMEGGKCLAPITLCHLPTCSCSSDPQAA